MTRSFPFIVGSPRSGTTLLRSMLNEHPMLAIPSESHFIPSLVGPPRLFADAVGRDPHFLSWNVKAVGLDRAATYPEAVRLLFGQYAALAGKSRYGDKTPGYAFHIPLLARLFPEAVFIHLIRDGRDAALSMEAVGFASNIDRAILKWRRHVAAARLAGAKLGDRYLEIRYESLVDEAEEALEGVCRFIGLEFERAMLEYPERIRAAGHYVRQQHLRHPPRRTRDWRAQLNAREAARVNVLAGDILAELGYAPASKITSVQLFERSRADLAHRRAELRGLRGRKYC